MAFTQEVQTAANGPWTNSFRARVAEVREKLDLSYRDLGDRFHFSDSFVHGLLTGRANYNMHSKHGDRVLQVLEGLEVQAGIRKLMAPSSDDPKPSDLATLVKHIHALGFSVELKPLAV